MKPKTAMIIAVALLFAFTVSIAEAGIVKKPRHRPVHRTLTYRAPSPEIGFQMGYDYDIEHWSIGLQGKIPLGMAAINFVPSARILFDEDDFDHDFDHHYDDFDDPYWQVDLDLAFGRAFYAGGGVAIADLPWNEYYDYYDAHDTRIGTNAFLGLRVPARRSPVSPYVETRWTFFEDETMFRLLFGVNFLIR